MNSESQLSNTEVASLLANRIRHLHGLQDQISMFTGRTVTLAELANSGLTADLKAPIIDQLKKVAEMLDRDGVTGRSSTNEARWKSAEAINKMLGRIHLVPLGCRPDLHA